ncbi:hypothetical protein SRHO_G00056570 [Serrasalmus rhombeus]
MGPLEFEGETCRPSSCFFRLQPRTAVSGTGPKQSEGEGALLLLELAGWVSRVRGCRARGVAIVARGADRTGQGERRDGRWSGGSGEMMSEMSLSGRDSIPQEGDSGR